MGGDFNHAQHKAKCFLIGWGYRYLFGDGHWTPRLEQLAHEAYEEEQEFANILVQNVKRQLAEMEAQGIALPLNAVMPPSTTCADVDRDPQTAPNATGARIRPTFYNALEQYSEAVRSRPGSDSYRRRLTETVSDIQHYAADLAATTELAGDKCSLARYVANPKASQDWQVDISLEKVDRLWLEQLTNFVKSRPLSRRIDSTTHRREKISPATVKTLLQHWRQAFDWLDSHVDRFGWEAPKKFGRLLFHVTG